MATLVRCDAPQWLEMVFDLESADVSKLTEGIVRLESPEQPMMAVLRGGRPTIDQVWYLFDGRLSTELSYQLALRCKLGIHKLIFDEDGLAYELA